MRLQKHWYLGFLGVVGVYELPKLISVFQPDGSWWDLTGALWFIWFLYFLPAADTGASDDRTE